MKVPFDWKNAVGFALSVALDRVREWWQQRKAKKEAEKAKQP